MTTKRNLTSNPRDWLLPAAVLAAAWLVTIHQLALEWTINPQYQYGWIVPLLTLLLWWQDWGRRPNPGRSLFSGFIPLAVGLLILSGLPLRIITEANPDWRPLNYYYAGQAVLVTALVVDYSGGKAWLRYFAFPLLFPLVAVPWPPGIETSIIQGLQWLIAALGVEASSWMGWSAFQRGSLIVLPQGVVGINEACSGIRSLQSSLMIALFLGAFMQLTTLRRCLLIVIGLALAFVLNVMRAFILIAVMGTHGIAAVAEFHDPAGFSIAVACLLLLWIIASFWAPPEAKQAPAVRTASGKIRFTPRWAVVLLAGWIAIEGVNQAWYYWHERNTVPGPLWTLQWPPPRPAFKDEKIDDEIRVYLHFSEGLRGQWTDQTHWDVFFLTWEPSRASTGLARFHHPDICLPASGYEMKEELGVKNITVKGVNLPVNRYVFQDPLTKRLFYVFQAVTDDRIGNQTAKWEQGAVGASFRLEAAWAGWRNPGQRSLLAINQGSTSLDAAEEDLRRFLDDTLIVSGDPGRQP